MDSNHNELCDQRYKLSGWILIFCRMDVFWLIFGKIKLSSQIVCLKEDVVCQSNTVFSQLSGALSLRSLSKNAIANLLDTLMVRFCEHLELCANNKRLSQACWSQVSETCYFLVYIKSALKGSLALQVFETLLQSFMKTILSTYKSKFAQVYFSSQWVHLWDTENLLLIGFIRLRFFPPIKTWFMRTLFFC